MRGDKNLPAEFRDLGQRLVEVGHTDDAKPAGLGIRAIGQRGDASACKPGAREDKIALPVGICLRRNIKADGVAIETRRILRVLRVKLEPVPPAELRLDVRGIARTRLEKADR